LKKILILKIGAIGDVVMALPLITEIRKTEPEAEIIWLCGKQVLPLLSRVEGIDQLLAVDEQKLLSRGWISRALEIFRIWRKLGFQRFDLLLYFYRSPLYQLLVWPAFFNQTRGFRDRNTGSRLPVQGRHHSNEYIRAFTGNGGPEEFLPHYPSYRLNPSEPKKKSAGKIIVLACGGARNLLQNNDLRRWPLAHYRSLADKIIGEGHELVLTGGPGDSWVREQFQGLPHTDLIGKLSLSEFIDYLATADLLVTHDSGPLHLADLAACPVLGLFGPTRPADFRSLQSQSRFIWGGEFLSCRPCYDGKDYAICQSNECLKSITPDQVFSCLKEMLAR
jgi:heptosyltransferase-2